ncbi:unnamed protein product (macronuclear) [Paramecium tetraurelia]|uniref:Uncharacterized protein n=1 Tax=Paramecium tetraurelia TaxID=5888 RepID=A0BVT6_PARTE|nr:uncharacterized protein GSPATT00032505001 [Paramecium tetraurelia]CAK62653.1 unnamed protein product [Paramecium tetraurelia]|eukprot:XP_001430051.1 hypothetical protein (macronuclear) [Paramecium tetraurelia strain d4-2]
MIYFFVLLAAVRSVYVGETPCASLAVASDCDNSGYCKVDTGVCVALPCYMVNEVAACRSGPSGSGIPTGALSSKCDSLEQFSLQYDNVCVDKGDGKLNFAFVRFSKTTDGSALSTTGSTSTLVGALTAVEANMFSLYTINPWKSPEASQTAATLKTELEAILDKYILFYQVLIDTSNSHPFYLERTTYQALQLIRDYVGFDYTMRKAILPKIWQVAEIALFRIAKFSPSYYQTNYYFINFASCPYSRRELKVNGQLHTVRIDWIGYTYSTNGYMQVYSYAAEQFGIRNALSDIIALRPTTSLTTAATINLDTLFTGFFLEWTWTDTNLVVVEKDIKLYQFDESAAVATDVVKQVTTTITCVSATKTCKTANIVTPITTATTRINYFFSYGPGKCVDKTEVQCKLSIEQGAQCTYNAAITTDYKCS